MAKKTVKTSVKSSSSNKVITTDETSSIQSKKKDEPISLNKHTKKKRIKKGRVTGSIDNKPISTASYNKELKRQEKLRLRRERVELNKKLGKVIDKLNNSLSRLEKAGMADKSRFYTDVQDAFKREVPYLHINKSGDLRYSAAYLKPTDIENRKELLKRLEGYLDYKTRTIKGVKDQASKALDTIENKYPQLKGKIQRNDIDKIHEIFKRLREQGYLDNYPSGDAMENIDKIKDKSMQEIENALNLLTEKEASTERGRIADSEALATLIGTTGQYVKNH